MDAMKYNDLRDFLTLLEQQGELKRITLPVDPHLEITEIADRTLRGAVRMHGAGHDAARAGGYGPRHHADAGRSGRVRRP